MSRTPFRRRSSEARAAAASGQTLAEYAVVIAAIAVAVMVALLFLVAGIKGRFDSTPSSPQAPFVPPRTPTLSYPATLEDCEEDGWRNYVQFDDEEECKKYVEQHTP
jgi:Flp pilus assembly pilin Flp